MRSSLLNKSCIATAALALVGCATSAPSLPEPHTLPTAETKVSQNEAAEQAPELEAKADDAQAVPSAEPEFPPTTLSEAVEICAKTFEPINAPIPRERMINDFNDTFKEPNRINVTWSEGGGSRVVCSVGTYTKSVEDFKRGYGLQRRNSGKKAIRLIVQSFNDLNDNDKNLINDQFDITLREADSYGIVQDVQTVNRSTPGSNVGSAVGSGVAGLAYLNRSLSGNNNYSMWAHLGLMVLGGVIGSAADKAPEEMYESQYTVKLKDGSTKQIVTGHSSAFVVPVGSCMDLTYENLADGMCWQSAEDIRVVYLGKAREPEPSLAKAADVSTASTISVADELLKLSNLQKQGVLSKAEFEAQKKKLLEW